jgi:propionate CoA-transferase
MPAQKLITGQQMARSIPDCATIAIPGNASIMVVDHLLAAIEARFLAEGHPAELNAYVPCNAGLGPGTGVDRLAHSGMLHRYVASAFPVYDGSPLAHMITRGDVEAYNFPMGVLYGLLRDASAGRPGMLTEVGIGTYVDPRNQGGRMNARTKEDLVELTKVAGREVLFYKAPHIDVTLLKATSADDMGNLSLESEPLTLGALPLATAARARGGKVFAQVERIVQRHSQHPRSVIVPAHFVDGIVLAADAPQSAASRHDPTLTGEERVPRYDRHVEAGPVRVITARAASELRAGWLVNLGVGVPSNLPVLLSELGLLDAVTITTEHGAINGMPNPLPIFGAHTNPDCILDPPSVFDFYDGGTLDAAFLGLAEADANGDVNVSMFNGRLMGCGGFIDITARTPNVFFCGALTAGGAKVRVEDGKLRIDEHGRLRKLVKNVQHLTFNGRSALAKGQQVHIITERGVFKLSERGWILIEYAPGVDPRRDIEPYLDFPLTIAENARPYSAEIMETDSDALARSLVASLRRMPPDLN